MSYFKFSLRPNCKSYHFNTNEVIQNAHCDKYLAILKKSFLLSVLMSILHSSTVSLADTRGRETAISGWYQVIIYQTFNLAISKFIFSSFKIQQFEAY